jgi:release factor glutamine methyltransferase
MNTPSYSHLSSSDFDHVYEPAEDSFLLLDALEQELPFLQSRKPLITVEIGSGSGLAISALAKYLNFQSHGFHAIDINKFACDATKRTARENGVNVEVINMDLLTAFKPNSVDLLLFNPPYVPTTTDEVTENIPEQKKFYDRDAERTCSGEKLLIKSWAGGKDGCEIINRLLSNLKNILTPKGLFYLLLIKENNPEKIRKELKSSGFESEQIIDRKIRGEHLLVLKIYCKEN